MIQNGNESRVTWFAGLTALPGDRPTYADNPEMLHRIASTNHQHPDHDTEALAATGATSMAEFRMTGGCQCGAIRYALHEQPANPHICHCRMCQKAFGSFFAPLLSMCPSRASRSPAANRRIFKSSDIAERGFCRACGTPLTSEWLDDNDADICGVDRLRSTIRRRSSPTYQYGVEGQLPILCRSGDACAILQTHRRRHAGEGGSRSPGSNHQHPDHDTAAWPPAEGCSQ